MENLIYIPSSLHSPESPYYRGLKTFAIDAITGEEKWSLGISVAGQHTRSSLQLRVADGYLTIGARDGYMYVVGKGKSATSVTAPASSCSSGSKLYLNRNSTRHVSCPTRNSCNRWTNPWMLGCNTYTYNYRKPNNATGVKVDLTALCPNGNPNHHRHKQQATIMGSSVSHGHQKFQATKIIASFAGTNSYGSSTATTYLSAIDEPVSTPQPTTEAVIQSLTNYFVRSPSQALSSLSQ